MNESHPSLQWVRHNPVNVSSEDDTYLLNHARCPTRSSSHTRPASCLDTLRILMPRGFASDYRSFTSLTSLMGRAYSCPVSCVCTRSSNELEEQSLVPITPSYHLSIELNMVERGMMPVFSKGRL